MRMKPSGDVQRLALMPLATLCIEFQIVAPIEKRYGYGSGPPSSDLNRPDVGLKRAMNDGKVRHFFGVASGEYDFQFYTDVTRALEWIDGLVDAEAEQSTDPAGPRKISIRKAGS